MYGVYILKCLLRDKGSYSLLASHLFRPTGVIFASLTDDVLKLKNCDR